MRDKVLGFIQFPYYLLGFILRFPYYLLAAVALSLGIVTAVCFMVVSVLAWFVMALAHVVEGGLRD